jgi:hypothetical protein
MERPYSGRAKFKETVRGFTIEVPSRKNWLTIIFLIALLGAWLLGEIIALVIVVGNLGRGNAEGFASLFLLFWLLIWTAVGFFFIRTVVWMIAGKEIISFSKIELKIRKKALMFSKPEIYDIREVKNFSINTKDSIDNHLGSFSGTKVWNLNNPEAFKFDYGIKTVRLVKGIDEAEAKYLLDKIQKKNLLRE